MVHSSAVFHSFPSKYRTTVPFLEFKVHSNKFLYFPHGDLEMLTQRAKRTGLVLPSYQFWPQGNSSQMADK